MKRNKGQSDSISEFLTELATHLIASGINLQTFQEMTRSAFVSAASSKARLRNARVNQSALAAITGLNRAQVRAILKEGPSGGQRRRDPVLQVIDGWSTDSNYHLPTGRPAKLTLKGGRGTFSALVRQYGSDVTAKAVLRELLRLKRVRIAGDFVELLSEKGTGTPPLPIHSLAATLARALKSPDVNSTKRLRTIYFEKRYATLSKKDAAVLRRRIAQTFRAFSSDIDSAVSAVQTTRQGIGKRAAANAKMGIILVSQD